MSVRKKRSSSKVSNASLLSGMNTSSLTGMNTSLSPGMTTTIWGPLMWNLMNDVASISDRRHKTWNKDENKHPSRFFHLLQYILPCKWCRESYGKFIKKTPPTYPYMKWVYDVHCKVNKKLHKQQILTFEDFKRRDIVYTSFGSTATLWDICYILILNYNPQTKSQVYKKFFEELSWWVTWLVNDKEYESDILELKNLPSSLVLKDKYSMLKWINKRRKCKQKCSYMIRKYANAITKSTDQELWNICGPLLTKAWKNENK